jgi:fermentation-respiration switch protein FrsA (DUF1100 family)
LELAKDSFAAHVAEPGGHPRLRRVAVLGGSLVPVGAIVALGAIGWAGAERAIHRAPNAYRWRVGDYPNLRAEGVAITSRTGVVIAGRFFPGRSRTTIILSHGYGDHGDQMLPWADFLNRAGYGTFIYDMRSRGASGGDAITLGALEREDLLSVIDYVASRPDADAARLGALGVSLGGAATILAAASDPRIKVVVDDCGFSDAPGVINTTFAHFVRLPPFPFAPLSVKIAEWRTGARLSQVRPVDVVGRLAPRPLLIIHGLTDPYVPPAHSERLFAAAGEPKSAWYVPGAGHAQSREIAGGEYERRVVAFFKQYLGD